jgi:hypothetical protein
MRASDPQMDKYMLADTGWSCTRGCGAELDDPSNQTAHNLQRHLFARTPGHDPEVQLTMAPSPHFSETDRNTFEAKVAPALGGRNRHEKARVGEY